MDIEKVFLTGFVLLSSALLWRFLVVFWWRPKSLAAKIRSQGIRGPSPKFMMGNMLQIGSIRRAVLDHPPSSLTHDILDHLLPDYAQFSAKYGKRYVYWWGTEPRIMIHEPELIREILAKKVTQFEKSDLMVAGIISFLGRGLASVNGSEWSHHRRVVAPAFYVDKLKKMIPTFAKCANDMLDRWDDKLKHQNQLEVCGEFQKFAADAISHTAFGSSYLKGQRVFEILNEIPEQARKVQGYNWIPYNRYLPFRVNFRIAALRKELNSLLLGLIKERREAAKSPGGGCSYGSDLLGLMIAEAEHDKSTGFDDSIIVGECKTFYLAGQETTASLLSWTLMLLGAYPEWQERTRAEVLEVCKDAEVPDDEMINKLKLMKMILHESLRLYPPVVLFQRGCFEDTNLDGLLVPKGAAVTFPVVAIQRNKELWGPDAGEFNPERFKDGISGACKHPNAFLAFSMGPRVCVGQSFALIEARVALVAILRRYSFRLSPDYVHNPNSTVILKPREGLPLILEKL